MGPPRKGPPPACAVPEGCCPSPRAVRGRWPLQAPQVPRAPLLSPVSCSEVENCCSLESVFLQSMSAAWIAGMGPSLQCRTRHSRPDEPRVWRKETGLASSFPKLVPLLSGQSWGGGCSFGTLRPKGLEFTREWQLLCDPP